MRCWRAHVRGCESLTADVSDGVSETSQPPGYDRREGGEADVRRVTGVRLSPAGNPGPESR